MRETIKAQFLDVAAVPELTCDYPQARGIQTSEVFVRFQRIFPIFGSTDAALTRHPAKPWRSVHDVGNHQELTVGRPVGV